MHRTLPISQRLRTALVVGVANQRSLAWHSAVALASHNNFDHVIVTYQNERFQSSVERMVDKYNSNSDGSVTGSVTGSGSCSLSCLPCDVTHEDQIQQLFQERIPSLLETLNGDSDSDSGSNSNSNSNNQRVALDAMVHSVAYAPASAMKNASASLSVDDDDDDDETDKQLSLSLLNTSREDFNTAHAISAHSLITMSKYALPLLSCQYDHDHDHDGESDDHDDDGIGIRSPSITTLSYLGATRAVSNYNIMGPAKASLESIVRGLAFELSPPPHRIRVNAVSAGPVNTLSARGIKDFGILRSQVEGRSMLRRSVTGEEVGNVVDFVASGKASGITGQVLFCDGGYSSVG